MMETVAKSAVPTETSLLLGIGDEVWMGLVLAILTILVCYHFLFSESQTGVILTHFYFFCQPRNG